MKQKIKKALLAACLVANLAADMFLASVTDIRATEALSELVENGLVIEESKKHQLLKEDIALPRRIRGLEDAEIMYDVIPADSPYASVEGDVLEITRPNAGDGNFDFILRATVSSDGAVYTKQFPLTVWENFAEDSYAGYIYCCFADTKKDISDVQQVHFFLSEDGLNWTALNGCNPAFLAGNDFRDDIISYGENSTNYYIRQGTKIEDTVSGDASVLFPFEGRDQGIRDPYLIRGCKEDGSDSGKIWLLATDLNIMATVYGGDPSSNRAGDWGEMTHGEGSTHLFIYETEDWVHWTRRWIDVGSEIGAGAAWAPEAIYNPAKDNYLVYWSCRVEVDGYSRNRLYCNETEDFVNFGPTKLYEAEPFYSKNWAPSGVSAGDDGYGNIDTSQLWVAEKDENGNVVNPYGTLYRLVKDETDNHIELMSAKTVLDPDVDYEKSNPVGIKPYTLDGKTYRTLTELNTLTSDARNYKRADIVYHWFQDQSTGNHFEYIEQNDMEKYNGAFEGATMFKFIDRDEWCIMIDNYGTPGIRYEPYVTTDLSEPNSIKKLTGGYGRTSGDIGCHGTMIPITAGEYNRLIDTYNADPTVDNYHPIDYIEIDHKAPVKNLKAQLKNRSGELLAALSGSSYSEGVMAQMRTLLTQIAEAETDKNAESVELSRMLARIDALLKNKRISIPENKQEPTEIIVSDALYLDEDELVLCTKKTEGLGTTAKLTAELNVETDTQAVIFSSSNPEVAVVDHTGAVTAKKAGSAIITAATAGGLKAECSVTVMGVPDRIILKKKSIRLKKGKSFQIKATVPKGTVCSKFTYQSDKKKVASVSKTGKITARKKGTARITVRAGNHSKAKAVLKVNVK